MSRKHFSWLAVLALAAVIIAVLLPGNRVEAPATGSSLLLVRN